MPEIGITRDRAAAAVLRVARVPAGDDDLELASRPRTGVPSAERQQSQVDAAKTAAPVSAPVLADHFSA